MNKQTRVVFQKMLGKCLIVTSMIGALSIGANAAHLKPIPMATPVPENADDANDQGAPASVAYQATLPQLEYYGGPVVSRLKVVAVLWGGGVDANVKQKIDGFFNAIVDSTYFDFMNSEYNTVFPTLNGYPGTQQKIGRGQYLGAKTIKPSNTSALLDDSASKYQVSAEINHQIAVGALPPNDEDTDYVIFLPPNVDVTAEFGTGITDWCAYHGAAPQPKGKYLQYAVVPDMTSAAAITNCVNGYGKGKLFKAVTYEVSGMLAAGVTDPHVAPAGTPTGGQPPETWIANDGETEIYASCTYPVTSYAHLKDGAQSYLVSPLFSRKSLACTTTNFRAR